MGKSVIAVWMFLCFFAGVAYCAYRRTQLREKFGIAGAPRQLYATARMPCTPIDAPCLQLGNCQRQIGVWLDHPVQMSKSCGNQGHSFQVVPL